MTTEPLTPAELAILATGELWRGFNTPAHQLCMGLVQRGLLRTLPRGTSPYHDGFKTTLKGRKAIAKAEQEATDANLRLPADA